MKLFAIFAIAFSLFFAHPVSAQTKTPPKADIRLEMPCSIRVPITPQMKHRLYAPAVMVNDFETSQVPPGTNEGACTVKVEPVLGVPVTATQPIAPIVSITWTEVVSP